jgi:hypothetical protein
MTRVVGTGCALSAVVAASAALPGDRLENVAAACGPMKQAGEIAARQEAQAALFRRFSTRCIRRCRDETHQRPDHRRHRSQRRGRYPGRSENLLRAGGLWLLGDHRPGGAEYPRRAVGLSHRTDFVAAQLDSVFSDVRIDTTKIGMLAETDIVEAVAERLARYGWPTWCWIPSCWRKAAIRCCRPRR